MVFSWEDSRRAFADAAQWFVRTTALVGDRWNRPGLGEWDVRALVGHTSRSRLTVETYLARPAAAAELASAVGYFRATRAGGPGGGGARRRCRGRGARTRRRVRAGHRSRGRRGGHRRTRARARRQPGRHRA